MKFLLTAIGALVIAVVIAVIARDDPGYLVINFRDWVVETSVVMALVVVAATFVILYLVVRMFINTRLLPQRLQHWQQQRRGRQAMTELTNGLLEMTKGDWSRAEKLLLRHVDNSHTPLLNYLAAARAAQKLGHDERRDHYLQMAHKVMPGSELAIGLTQAELQLNQGQAEQALATLTLLQQQSPRHATVIKLLSRLYVELHDWERLLELLPSMLKRKVVSRDEAEKLELMAQSELLDQAAADSDVRRLHETWQRVGKSMQHNAMLVQIYVLGLIKHDQGKEAEDLLNQRLNQNWDQRLVRLYGQLNGTDVSRQIRYAEDWLNHHRHDAALLLTLGRLCRRNRLWSQSRQYLEASLAVDALDAQAETRLELARLMDEQGDKEQALNYYRQALPQSGSTVSLPEPAGHGLADKAGS